jgi:hypothetical protein
MIVLYIRWVDSVSSPGYIWSQIYIYIYTLLLIQGLKR